jgi:hypothetical protein
MPKNNTPLTAEQWQLVVDALPQIDTIAARYWQKWTSAGAVLGQDDAISLGRLGAMSAARRWRPDGPAAFVTYAAWFVRSTIQAAGQKAVYGIYGGRYTDHGAGRDRQRVWHVPIASCGGIASSDDEGRVHYPAALRSEDGHVSLPCIDRYLMPQEREALRGLVDGIGLTEMARTGLWMPGSQRAGSSIGRVVSRERVRQYADCARWVMRLEADLATHDELDLAGYVDDCRRAGRRSREIYRTCRQRWPHIAITQEALLALYRYLRIKELERSRAMHARGWRQRHGGRLQNMNTCTHM